MDTLYTNPVGRAKRMVRREEMKEIIGRVLQRILTGVEHASPQTACIFSDLPACDVTTDYAIGEED